MLGLKAVFFPSLKNLRCHKVIWNELTLFNSCHEIFSWTWHFPKPLILRWHPTEITSPCYRLPNWCNQHEGLQEGCWKSWRVWDLIGSISGVNFTSLRIMDFLQSAVQCILAKRSRNDTLDLCHKPPNAKGNTILMWSRCHFIRTRNCLQVWSSNLDIPRALSIYILHA